VQRNAATFDDYQGVCKVSSTPEARGAAVAVRSGRCPVRAQGSKVRVADDPLRTKKKRRNVSMSAFRMSARRHTRPIGSPTAKSRGPGPLRRW
jgi:hypothetical protein